MWNKRRNLQNFIIILSDYDENPLGIRRYG